MALFENLLLFNITAITFLANRERNIVVVDFEVTSYNDLFVAEFFDLSLFFSFFSGLSSIIRFIDANAIHADTGRARSTVNLEVSRFGANFASTSAFNLGSARIVGAREAFRSEELLSEIAAVTNSATFGFVDAHTVHTFTFRASSTVSLGLITIAARANASRESLATAINALTTRASSTISLSNVINITARANTNSGLLAFTHKADTFRADSAVNFMLIADRAIRIITSAKRRLSARVSTARIAFCS